MTENLQPPTTDKDRYFVHSLAKGLAVLQAFSTAGRPLTLTEVARHLGVNKTTATRLCHTLSELGFMIRDRHRLFHLTPKVLTLGYSLIFGLSWREAACRFFFKPVRFGMLQGRFFCA